MPMECHEKFENVELLYDHTKQHAEKVDTVKVAPGLQMSMGKM